jgi:hypothetical protein
MTGMWPESMHPDSAATTLAGIHSWHQVVQDLATGLSLADNIG